jgi:pimeloyl-ACP methyl ester carboxylesterase
MSINSVGDGQPVNGLHTTFFDVGAGVPLVLLHGFPFSKEMWRPQLAPLSKRCRLIVPDLAGFGESEPIPAVKGPAHPARLADQVSVLLEQLRVPSAIICGLSMGGYVALSLARRRPTLVRALVLANTRATTDTEEGKQNREKTALAVLEKGPSYLVETLMPKLLSPNASPEVRDEVESMIRLCSAESAASASRGMARRDDSQGLLRKLEVPVLVISGSADALIPLADSEAMVGLCKQGKLSVLEGAGHMSNLEAPDAFNKSVLDFVDALPK